MADTSNGRLASVIILLADQADVNAAYGIKDQDARLVRLQHADSACRAHSGWNSEVEFEDVQGIIWRSHKGRCYLVSLQNS